MMDRVTVYISTYNYGDYLNTAIRSVLHQTYSDWNLVIVNDGSFDHTSSILKEYFYHPKVTIINNRDNKGLVQSSNIAIQNSSSFYIVRLDADDWFEPDALMHLVETSYKKDADIVIPEYWEVYRKGGSRHIQHSKYDDNNPPNGACCLIKRDFLSKIGNYDEEFDCQDGYYLYLQALKHNAKVEFLRRPIFVYYRHPNSLSSDSTRILNTRNKIRQKYYK